ncbi:putative membrane protein [Sinorhizobium fredii]|uniref:Conserved hypothetical membrane protein n=1 Tax=Sinorhizobium fredii (strain USDA 257) TaxID=1185652 RepID=I3XCS2_SINF2|nr:MULTISPECIES: DUF2231 domain-containing protein [Sinorhizobium]AFL53678.1 conserved hypothetical membrane protein [Sinorhizobium fredii USDA 257]PDT82978.1 DUF2231 domain-containing protein [Sinorhizobium sp. BJ1]
MSLGHSPSTATIPRYSIHSLFAAFPIACFTLALVTDIAFWQTAHVMWQNFSAWLLFAGVALGAIAALAGAVEFVVRRDTRAPREVLPHAICYLVILVIAFVNNLVHAADGWTAVVPYGLILSAVTVFVIVVAAVLDRALLYRAHTGVSKYG